MNSSDLRPLRALAVLTLCSLVAVGATAAKKGQKNKDAEKGESVTIHSWLVAGPQTHPLPVFADSKKGGVGSGDLLEEPVLSSVRIRPAAGNELSWFSGRTLRWRDVSTNKDGQLKLVVPAAGQAEAPAVAWLATYIAVDRWQKLELSLEGTQARRVWLDGEPLASGGKSDDDKPVTAKLELTPGTHVVLVKTVFDPEREAAWTLGGSVTGAEPADAVRLSLDPERNIALGDILDAPRITSMAVSPDGKKIVTSVSRVVPGTDDTESWVEIRRSSDGGLEDSWRGASGARRVAWSPDGRFVTYVAKAAAGGDDASTLFLLDRWGGAAVPLLEGIDRLGGYVWSPDGKAIVYSTTKKADKDERGVKLVAGLADRWASFRDKQFLHIVRVPDGTRRRLTAGELTTSAVDISPDGKRLLFTRSVEQLEQRPYSMTELWEMDLESFEATKLRDFNWFNDASYGPEGRRLLVSAPANEFDGAGLNLSRAEIANSYDGQLFLWDPATDEVDPITRDFDPSVGGATWNWKDGRIYFIAEERDRSPLFQYDPATRLFTRLSTGFDSNRRLDLPRTGPVAAVLGTSPWVPEHLVAVDLASGKARSLEHPSGGWFDGIRSGHVQPWTFTASSGKTIDGRIYFPPGFDEDERYPAIVYYYGGTSPVGRDFGGRYPKEWWASNGYVVYVLQPSGATGFGQDFSAVHVNDWGKTTADEVIEGTRKFLEAHPFVDPEGVGCLGASYGGFMTMLLSTKTDVFGAAVSHAGISSLSSYWGEGYWGALYSAVATADSFPWNRKDIYVDQSPLFRAQEHKVPILLTHGVADTNVPVGESDSFFIALKLLGKDVEYLQIEGEDHWILSHDKRMVWSSSIVAWFDRWLKDRPEWWNALYPDAATAPSEEDSKGAAIR